MKGIVTNIGFLLRHGLGLGTGRHQENTAGVRFRTLVCAQPHKGSACLSEGATDKGSFDGFTSLYHKAAVSCHSGNGQNLLHLYPTHSACVTFQLQLEIGCGYYKLSFSFPFLGHTCNSVGYHILPDLWSTSVWRTATLTLQAVPLCEWSGRQFTFAIVEASLYTPCSVMCWLNLISRQLRAGGVSWRQLSSFSVSFPSGGCLWPSSTDPSLNCVDPIPTLSDPQAFLSFWLRSSPIPHSWLIACPLGELETKWMHATASGWF